MKCFLSTLAVLAVATAADAQVVYQRVCGPNGCQLVPVQLAPPMVTEIRGLPSPAPFAPVPCQPPAAMPGVYACPAGICANCTCAAGSCPGSCPTTTVASGRVTYQYRFPVRGFFFPDRPRLFFR